MPLHSIRLLPTGARLGLWHLHETPADLRALLPDSLPYHSLLPATADTTRQAQWLAGRVLLHQLLAHLEAEIPAPILGCYFVNDTDGRPQLAGWPAAAVSLSHSGEWVAALLAPSGQAGLDVEQVRDKAQRLAGRFLSDTELNNAQEATDPTVFSLLWSIKETLYKLAGQRGLIFREHIQTQPVQALSRAPELGRLQATLHRAGGQTRHLVCYTQPAPGYVLTYCHEPADFSLTSLSS